MRTVFCCLLLVFFCSVTRSAPEPAGKDELVFMPSDEPAMRKAFERARVSLGNFLELARVRSPGLDNFAVKVGISDLGETEYFWISPFARSGEQFSGLIDNKPKIVRGIVLGQKYTFSRAQIVDWLYIDKSKKKMVGNFTLCALLTKESKEEAEAMRKRFRLDCED